MKRNRIHRLFIFFVMLLPHSQIFSQDPTDPLIREYKVQNIERVKNGFIIDVTDIQDNKWYTIVSARENPDYYPKIEIGNIYKLSLRPYFSEKIIPNLSIISLVALKGKIIKVQSRSWTGDIHLTENIIGKSYKKP